jgi:hypothetical protein
MAAAARELEMSAGSRDFQKHAVVARMIPKSTDLGQTHTIAVEGNHLIKPPRVPSDTQVQRRIGD